MSIRPCVRALLLVVALQLVLAPSAHAYLEPGSLNFVLQSIIASLLGVAITLKLYWRRMLAGLRSFFSSGDEDEESS